jgi:hypothetical protein
MSHDLQHILISIGLMIHDEVTMDWWLALRLMLPFVFSESLDVYAYLLRIHIVYVVSLYVHN